MNKIWAVGQKDWVELRESISPPKIHITTKRKEGETISRIPQYNANGGWNGKYTEHRSPTKTTIKIISATGGKVVAMVKRRSFTDRTGIKIAEGDLREVPEEIAVPIINDDWKKQHGVV